MNDEMIAAFKKIGDSLRSLGETVIKGDLPGHPFRGNQYEGGSGSVQVFHGTSADAVEKIRTEGLRAIHAGSTYEGISEKEKVYVAGHPEEARFWAKNARKNQGKSYAILTIEVPEDRMAEFQPDLRAGKMPPKITRLTGRDNTAMSYKGDIPPEWIKKIEVIER